MKKSKHLHPATSSWERVSNVTERKRECSFFWTIFRSETLDNDLGLLELARPIPFDENIQKISIGTGEPEGGY